MEKTIQFPDKPIDQLEITDDDLVPLGLFDTALEEMKTKHRDRMNVLEASLLKEGEIHISNEIRKMGVENEKTKKVISNSIYIQYLNYRLEN